MPKREWTVAELAQMLSHVPQDAAVKLLDADTEWTISKFDVIHEEIDGKNELWFYPCDYSEMG